ncbi:MAG: hypothetical protein NZ602_10450 [Thermoguttaceae bacterium]|nr:hypothetical protein [Thermoguttaceae bacterium]MDW8038075.1 hypothetical protein [Thermoguttaceae bacterium]
MRPLDRSGKAPGWLVGLGGLLLAALGPWGASKLWQAWKTLPSNSVPSSLAPSSGGGENSQWAEMPPHAPLQGEHSHPNDLLLPEASMSAMSQPPSSSHLAENTTATAPRLSFDELFRFDLTIREVLARWPRVSASLADLRLQGYRVPVVTGTSETDLAGALTYYFNPYQQLQRITFQGTTGDGRELVEFLCTRYGFQRRLTNDPSLFVYEVPRLGGPAQSYLRLKLAPTLKADQPHQRFDVWLVIERPEEPSKPFWQPQTGN